MANSILVPKMSNITISPQMANYQYSPTFDSTDENWTQSPTLTIIDLLNMNSLSILTNKLKISKKMQFKIRTPKNPRTNHFKSSRFLRIHVILSFSIIDTSEPNLNQPRNIKISAQNRIPNTHSNPLRANTKSFKIELKISCFQPPITII